MATKKNQTVAYTEEEILNMKDETDYARLDAMKDEDIDYSDIPDHGAEYLAAIFEENGAFGVAFPDFPGCVSHGEDLDDAKRMAQEALALHLRGMAEDDEKIPRPMGLSAAKAHELCEGADAFIFVQAPAIGR